MDTTNWDGVGRSGRDLFTRNLVPGHRVYGEELRRDGDVEWRQWDPFRSKLAAYLLKGAPRAPWTGAMSVLYLGGSHGTTVSHLSDLLPKATLFVVEKSPVSFAPLLRLARQRPNILPILADAQLPERYSADVGPVDLLYQDVAQRAQARIFVENADAVLAPGGVGLLMLKVRSVTQSRPVRAVVEEARKELTAHAYPTTDTADLGPFARDHVALAVRAPAPPSVQR